ncbi:hypothetical protein quinque_016467 [Culex quinquefasciatus]
MAEVEPMILVLSRCENPEPSRIDTQDGTWLFTGTFDAKEKPRFWSVLNSVASGSEDAGQQILDRLDGSDYWKNRNLASSKNNSCSIQTSLELHQDSNRTLIRRNFHLFINVKKKIRPKTGPKPDAE